MTPPLAAEPPFDPAWLDTLAGACRSLTAAMPRLQDLYLERRLELKTYALAGSCHAEESRSEGAAARWRYPSRTTLHARTGCSPPALEDLLSRHARRTVLPRVAAGGPGRDRPASRVARLGGLDPGARPKPALHRALSRPPRGGGGPRSLGRRVLPAAGEGRAGGRAPGGAARRVGAPTARALAVRALRSSAGPPLAPGGGPQGAGAHGRRHRRGAAPRADRPPRRSPTWCCPGTRRSRRCPAQPSPRWRSTSSTTPAAATSRERSAVTTKAWRRPRSRWCGPAGSSAGCATAPAPAASTRRTAAAGGRRGRGRRCPGCRT